MLISIPHADCVDSGNGRVIFGLSLAGNQVLPTLTKSRNMPSNSAFVAAIAGALLMAAMIVVVFNKDHADSGSQPCAFAPPDSLARTKTLISSC